MKIAGTIVAAAGAAWSANVAAQLAEPVHVRNLNPLVAVFGALFMSADAVFEQLVARLVRFDFEWVAGHVVLFCILAWLSSVPSPSLTTQRAAWSRW